MDSNEEAELYQSLEDKYKKIYGIKKKYNNLRDEQKTEFRKTGKIEAYEIEEEEWRKKKEEEEKKSEEERRKKNEEEEKKREKLAKYLYQKILEFEIDE